jgi:hypothetical protein
VNGAELERVQARLLEIGYPKGGKTGSIAALLNAGFKVRMINLEAKNYVSLTNNIDPRARKNLDIVTLTDKLRNTDQYIGTDGIPTAFNDAIKLLMEWKTKDAKGVEYSLGRPADWGDDTILVLDSLTALGEVAFRRAQKMMNKTPLNMTQQVWGLAVADQINFIKLMNSAERNYHTVTLAHLQMVGPDSIKKEDEANEVNADIKEQIASLITTKLFPRAVTRNASTIIAKEFSSMVEAKKVVKNGKTMRVISTTAGEEMDLGFPVKVPDNLPVETGLATLFEALGYPGPGL